MEDSNILGQNETFGALHAIGKGIGWLFHLRLFLYFHPHETT